MYDSSACNVKTTGKCCLDCSGLDLEGLPRPCTKTDGNPSGYLQLKSWAGRVVRQVALNGWMYVRRRWNWMLESSWKVKYYPIKVTYSCYWDRMILKSERGNEVVITLTVRVTRWCYWTSIRYAAHYVEIVTGLEVNITGINIGHKSSRGRNIRHSTYPKDALLHRARGIARGVTWLLSYQMLGMLIWLLLNRYILLLLIKAINLLWYSKTMKMIR